MNIAILALIASLNSMNVHGTKAQCEKLVEPMVSLVAEVTSIPEKSRNDTPHFGKALDDIKKFKETCEKTPKVKNQ